MLGGTEERAGLSLSFFQSATLCCGSPIAGQPNC